MKINIPQDSKNAMGSWYLGLSFARIKNTFFIWIFVENEHEKIVFQQATAQLNFLSNAILFSNLSG